LNPKRKKIIIIGPAYPYRGGNALFVTSMYETLKEYFNVKIYNYKLLYPSLLFPGTTQFDKSEKQVFKVPSHRIVNSISPLNWIIIARRIIKEKVDLIIFDWWHPFFGPCHGIISILIKNKYKGKILFVTENVVSHESNRIDKILTRFGLKNASMFLTLSQNVEVELGNLFKDKKIYRAELPVYDCYKSEDSKELQSLKKELGIDAKDKVILFFGYVRKYKGLDILIEAFSKILGILQDTFLLIVGEFYDNQHTYLEQIKKYNIEHKVKVINKFVPNEEVSKYYSISDVVVLPYKSATQSGILNIAYGFNKPVIATNVGGLAEFIVQGKTGLVVKPNSADALANGYFEFLKIKEKEDFESNISEHNRNNSFNKLPVLINSIIENIKE
jgi:D-inositol-3-phosphate glycosyltransferase